MSTTNLPTSVTRTSTYDASVEAARQAAAAKVKANQVAVANASNTYNANPSAKNLAKLASTQGTLAVSTANMERTYATGYTTTTTTTKTTTGSTTGTTVPQNTERVGVSSTGESKTPESVPSTNQTDAQNQAAADKEAADKEAADKAASTATESDLDGFYSDVNPSYVFDKRIQVMRTADKAKQVFFLETYKSIYNTLRALQGGSDTNKEGASNSGASNSGANNSGSNKTGSSSSTKSDREPKQDVTRFPTNITITINRAGIFRAGEEDKADSEFKFDVYFPPNEGKTKEDFMVDSCLWCQTSFNESVSVIPPTFETALAPARGDYNFVFPVFYVANMADGKNWLAPLSNIKYYNLHYNPAGGVVDLVFWSNVRKSYLEDTTGKAELYNAYPFTREKDLRNVGRVLMSTTGFYDKAIIAIGEKSFVRNIFVFGTPTIIQNPGVGGEFNNFSYEPVVDSLPWGFKFVEFTA